MAGQLIQSAVLPLNEGANSLIGRVRGDFISSDELEPKSCYLLI